MKRTRAQTDDLAEALRACLISPNVCDSNLEPANLIDVLSELARGMNRVGSGKATEDLGESLTHAAERMALSLDSIAASIDNLAYAVEQSRKS